MKKEYIFHYDKTKQAWNGRIHKMLLSHDGMKCTADIEDEDYEELYDIDVVFDDGASWNVYGYELEEVLKHEN